VVKAVNYPHTYDPQAPYGRDQFGHPLSDKSRVTAGMLQIVGFFIAPGIGRLYLGDTRTGLIQLLVCVFGWFTMWMLIGIPIILVMAIWSGIDGIVILTGSVRDPQGRTLRS
jgi:TM2 domain-containing membrane protein YozV